MNSSELKGKFDIVAPGLSDEWPDCGDSFTFTISPSPGTSKHLWISFELGVVSGVMRSTGPPPTTINTPCDFTWRGTESGEGEMTFQDCNVASVIFLGDGKIKGTISGDLFEDVDFVGKLKKKVAVLPKHVKEWKKTYRGINSESYRRAEKMRWGGWMDEDGCEGLVDDSDTTDGGEKGDREDEERWGDEDGGSDDDFYVSRVFS